MYNAFWVVTSYGCAGLAQILPTVQQDEYCSDSTYMLNEKEDIQRGEIARVGQN